MVPIQMFVKNEIKQKVEAKARSEASVPSKFPMTCDDSNSPPRMRGRRMAGLRLINMTRCKNAF